MDPIRLQKHLKNNANDLQEFCKDLKLWGEDMKRKDDALKNSPAPKKTSKTDKSGTTIKPARKIGTTDYAAWDKFDVDTECDKLDGDLSESPDISDDNSEQAVDKALLEKEKGNRFVKQQKWQQAIHCYSKAIELWMYDPVFYANRALCHLKLSQFEDAESDCTYSIRRDKTYVKAYQRRATARESLNKLEQAEYDWMKVLELEPNNVESKKALEKLQNKINNTKGEIQRPVSKFTASRNQTKPIIVEEKVENKSQVNSDRIIVKPIKKAPHLRSKKPLRRVDISETNDADEKGTLSKVIEKVEAWPKPNSSTNHIRCDDFKIIERKNDEFNVTDNKELTNNVNKIKETSVVKENVLVPPKTSVQFYSIWKSFQTSTEKYDYLKIIPPESIPDIFQESLESKAFSELLEVMSRHFIEEKHPVFNYLKYFTQVKRFSTFTIFFTSDDTKNLWKLFDFSKEFEGVSKEEVDEVIKKYEI